jgi:hypothetical protein
LPSDGLSKLIELKPNVLLGGTHTGVYGDPNSHARMSSPLANRKWIAKNPN